MAESRCRSMESVSDSCSSSESDYNTSELEYESDRGQTTTSGSSVYGDDSGSTVTPEPEKKLDYDEDTINARFIPKLGTFYEHDVRTAVDDRSVNTNKDAEQQKHQVEKKKVWNEHVNQWRSDKYNDNEQKPKSREELIKYYGYDIRSEDGPPMAGRGRRYGRGPHKYTRNWKDTDAYKKPRSGRRRGGGDGRRDRRPRPDNRRPQPRSDDTVESSVYYGSKVSGGRDDNREEPYARRPRSLWDETNPAWKKESPSPRNGPIRGDNAGPLQLTPPPVWREMGVGRGRTEDAPAPAANLPVERGAGRGIMGPSRRSKSESTSAPAYSRGPGGIVQWGMYQGRVNPSSGATEKRESGSEAPADKTYHYQQAQGRKLRTQDDLVRDLARLNIYNENQPIQGQEPQMLMRDFMIPQPEANRAGRGIMGPSRRSKSESTSAPAYSRGPGGIVQWGMYQGRVNPSSGATEKRESGSEAPADKTYHYQQAQGRKLRTQDDLVRDLARLNIYNENQPIQGQEPQHLQMAIGDFMRPQPEANTGGNYRRQTVVPPSLQQQEAAANRPKSYSSLRQCSLPESGAPQQQQPQPPAYSQPPHQYYQGGYVQQPVYAYAPQQQQPPTTYAAAFPSPPMEHSIQPVVRRPPSPHYLPSPPPPQAVANFVQPQTQANPPFQGYSTVNPLLTTIYQPQGSIMYYDHEVQTMSCAITLERAPRGRGRVAKSEMYDPRGDPTGRPENPLLTTIYQPQGSIMYYDHEVQTMSCAITPERAPRGRGRVAKSEMYDPRGDPTGRPENPLLTTIYQPQGSIMYYDHEVQTMSCAITLERAPRGRGRVARSEMYDPRGDPTGRPESDYEGAVEVDQYQDYEAPGDFLGAGEREASDDETEQLPSSVDTDPEEPRPRTDPSGSEDHAPPALPAPGVGGGDQAWSIASDDEYLETAEVVFYEEGLNWSSRTF